MCSSSCAATSNPESASASSYVVPDPLRTPGAPANAPSYKSLHADIISPECVKECSRSTPHSSVVTWHRFCTMTPPRADWPVLQVLSSIQKAVPSSRFTSSMSWNVSDVPKFLYHSRYSLREKTTSCRPRHYTKATTFCHAPSSCWLTRVPVEKPVVYAPPAYKLLEVAVVHISVGRQAHAVVRPQRVLHTLYVAPLNGAAVAA